MEDNKIRVNLPFIETPFWSVYKLVVTSIISLWSGTRLTCVFTFMPQQEGRVQATESSMSVCEMMFSAREKGEREREGVCVCERVVGRGQHFCTMHFWRAALRKAAPHLDRKCKS